MGRYSVNNRFAGTQQATSTSYKSQISVAAATATLCRGSLVDVSFGADGAPNSTDAQVVYDLSRLTTAGTATAITPQPVDNALGAANTVAQACFTGEPTVTGGTGTQSTSSLYMIALNQRASLRVFFDQGLRWPAVNFNGIVGRALASVYTGNISFQMTFDE